MSPEQQPAPYPIKENRDTSPFELRCNEIDVAAITISDPDAFAEAAKGDRELDRQLLGY